MGRSTHQRQRGGSTGSQKDCLAGILPVASVVRAARGGSFDGCSTMIGSSSPSSSNAGTTTITTTAQATKHLLECLIRHHYHRTQTALLDTITTTTTSHGMNQHPSYHHQLHHDYDDDGNEYVRQEHEGCNNGSSTASISWVILTLLLQHSQQLDMALISTTTAGGTSTSSSSSPLSSSSSSCSWDITRQLYIQSNMESGYTPLHTAIYRKDIIRILLLLRHLHHVAHGGTMSGLRDSTSRSTTTTTTTTMNTRSSHWSASAATTTTTTIVGSSVMLLRERFQRRPMDLLDPMSSSTYSPLLDCIRKQCDYEGMTPWALLAMLQRIELKSCRQYCLVVVPKILSSSTTTVATNANKPSTKLSKSPDRRRNNSLDGMMDDDEEEEQNEFQDLFHNLNRLQQQQQQRDKAKQKAQHHHHMDPTKMAYAAEVFTFGLAHHCALGVAPSGQTKSTGILSPMKTTTSTGIDGTSYSSSSISSSARSHQFHPQRVATFTASRASIETSAIAIAAATHHTLVVTCQGHLYAFGLGKGGRLGIGDESHCPLPTRVMGCLSSRRIIAVAAADNHSLCVSECGSVYAWGSNRFGQVTTTTGTTNDQDGNTRLCCFPRRVDELKHIPCVAVAAGEKHSVALSQQGEVYVWGDNSAGQLGIEYGRGNSSSIQRVQRVEALWKANKVAITIAASDQTTMVLVRPYGSGLPINSIYSWGQGRHVPCRVHFDEYNNRASNNSSSTTSTTTRLINPVAIACARYHHVAITADGLVYTWGLHEDALGRKSKKMTTATATSSSSSLTTAALTSGMATPELVTGMLPENGGGIAVAVAASENHTVVVTDTGALYTWGATYRKDILGHEGVRWQPDPKRVPGVCRAIGVAAAKEHTVLLIGVSLPPLVPIPPPSSLGLLASRAVAEHVDLFNILPLRIMADRTHCSFLRNYCDDFIRRNLDGVLNVAQKSVMDCFLNEQLNETMSVDHADRDSSYHPLVTEFLLPERNRKLPNQALSTDQWLLACEHLSHTPAAKNIMHAFGEDTSIRQRSRSRTDSIPSSSNVRSRSGCSERCLVLTTAMDLSTMDSVASRLACLTKEMRGVKKRLGQITKLQVDQSSRSVLSPDQVEKISRRPQLEADLKAYETAIETVEKRQKELTAVDSSCESNDAYLEYKEIPEQDKGIPEQSKQPPEQDIETDANASQLDSFRCDICHVTCPDGTSYELHLNGRKHRNRITQAADEEQKKVALAMMEQRLFEEMKKETTSIADAAKQPSWSTTSTKPNTQPKFNLPPPPHPVPESLVTATRVPPSLREIMAEEAKRSEQSKAITKKHSSIIAPAVPKKVATSGGVPQPASSTPVTVHKPFLVLPSDAPPMMKSPPWASAPVLSGSSAVSPTPKLTKKAAVSISETRTPTACTVDSPKAPLSLGDFITPSDQIRSPKSSSPRAVRWVHSKVSTHIDNGTTRSKSLRDIQQEEEDWKTREVPSAGSNGKWFVERRERAGSFREIERDAEQERTHRLFVEEQYQIEKQIEEENKERAAAATETPHRDHSSPRGRRNRRTRMASSAKNQAHNASNIKGPPILSTESTGVVKPLK